MLKGLACSSRQLVQVRKNSLTLANDNILDWSKLKAFADD